jgi:hypothetical protein
MRIILERRRTHFSASRLVWQEVRVGKIDFYHGLLAPGAFVQIDDYDSYEGCYKTVDEFLEEHPELELLKGGHFTACWYFRRRAAAPPMLAADQIGA